MRGNAQLISQKTGSNIFARILIRFCWMMIPELPTASMLGQLLSGIFEFLHREHSALLRHNMCNHDQEFPTIDHRFFWWVLSESNVAHECTCIILFHHVRSWMVPPFSIKKDNTFFRVERLTVWKLSTCYAPRIIAQKHNPVLY